MITNGPRLTQSQFIRQYNETNREEFNPAFFQRDNQDIMNAIKSIAYSCERDRYFTLKVLETREIYDYEEIYNTLREHEERRKKKSSTENSYDFIDIKDSDIMLLEIKYLVRHNGTERQEDENKKIIEVSNPWEIVQVLIALPRFVRKYYFRLNGNYYTSTFQIVDGSTYNNSNVGGATKKADCNTFKTMFMPVRIFRMFKDIMDFRTKTTVRCTLYTSIIFSNHVNTMFYILANYGLYGTFDFLDIRCIRILNEPVADDRWFSFQRHNLFICLPKECIQDPMVQSLVATIYDGIGKDTTLDDIFKGVYWIQLLGKCFKNESVDKGLFVLDSIDGIYDIITRDSLHLPDEYKQNIYQIFRWLMREFVYLKNKDNIDLTIKKIRLAEYIAHVYATKLSTGLHRVSDMGKRVTLRSVIKAIYTSPMFVINSIINMSNLVAYRDLVNDNDATLALKYTYKGISGLGEDGSAVQKLYKHVNPTQAGIVDLDASTESDPGMSGMFCPMATLYGGNSFSEYQEPNYWEEKYKPYQTNFFMTEKPNLTPAINVDPNVPPSYMNMREQIINQSLEISRTKCPIFNLKDPNIQYTSFGSQLNYESQTSNSNIDNKNSLFTVRQEE